MVFALAACALAVSSLLVLGVPPFRTQPEQVHLSYPGKRTATISLKCRYLECDKNVLEQV